MSMYDRLIRVIDERIAIAMDKSNMLREIPAVVVSVNATTGCAEVMLRGDVASKATYINKSGETLTAGDSVWVCWRGVLSTSTGYIARRAGKPVYP